MMEFDEDDLPGVVSWWPEAAEVISRRRLDYKTAYKLDGVAAAKQRKASLRYYNENKAKVAAAKKTHAPRDTTCPKCSTNKRTQWASGRWAAYCTPCHAVVNKACRLARKQKALTHKQKEL